ncbi:MAG: hypothetical protein JXA99_13000 [Candidatus Lokiarchaeota archaeon]|nr:hypothetical protein [Candidatus Lokiarchaeota archaeon]
MSRRIDLLRLDYLFSVIIPLIIAIYLNNLRPIEYIDIIIGFCLLGIAGNTWNDAIDMKNSKEYDTIERVKGYSPREIFTIGIAAFILGITLLLRTCIANYINAILLLIAALMVISYCKWIKPIIIVNQIFLTVSHVILPYFIIKIDAQVYNVNYGELIFLIAFFITGTLGQLVHEIIDDDSMRHYLSLRQCQFVVWIFSIFSAVFIIWSYFLLQDYYFLPLLIIPLGTIFTFRKPTKSSQGVKDVGIIIGNFLLIYFLCLMIMNSISLT